MLNFHIFTSVQIESLRRARMSGEGLEEAVDALIKASGADEEPEPDPIHFLERSVQTDEMAEDLGILVHRFRVPDGWLYYSVMDGTPSSPVFVRDDPNLLAGFATRFQRMMRNMVPDDGLPPGAFPQGSQVHPFPGEHPVERHYVVAVIDPSDPYGPDLVVPETIADDVKVSLYAVQPGGSLEWIVHGDDETIEHNIGMVRASLPRTFDHCMDPTDPSSGSSALEVFDVVSPSQIESVVPAEALDAVGRGGVVWIWARRVDSNVH